MIREVSAAPSGRASLLGASSRSRKRMRRLAVASVVVVASVALTGCFGSGLYLVKTPLTSRQMPPGLWRSYGGNQCTWLRVGAGGAVLGRNVRTNGPQYMQLEPSDFGAAIGNCSPFFQEPGAYARPIVQPGSAFGDGDFLVGYEVAPGTYRATSPPGQVCSWSVVRGFHGTDASGHNPDRVRGDTTAAGAPTAVIAAGDYGFTSQGCGLWHLVTPLPAAPGGASTSGVSIDGVVEDFPDPFVLHIDDPTQCEGTAPCYFAYSTESGFLGLVNVPVASSTDLSTWSWAGPTVTAQSGAPVPHDAMPVLAPWVQFGGNWAPSVLYLKDNPTAQRYVMYYTAKSKAAGSSGEECVGIATSATPQGPFVDTASAPAICNVAEQGTIDPSPYVAADGSLYLTYADNAGIRSQRLRSNGLAPAGGEQLIMHFDNGYSWELPRIEGPSLFSTPATGLVLLYSAGTFDTPTYSVGAAACDSPLGPCFNLYSTPMLASRGAMLGPGGQTPFQDGNGSWWLAFHAWDNVVGYPAGGARTLHFLPMSFPGGKPAAG